MPLDLTAIILTYNEEIHIRRCIENVRRVAKEIFVIDSFSNDRTVEITKEYENVQVLQNRWENNYSRQFNWGLEHAPITTRWALRLDADEYLTDELVMELEQRVPGLAENQTGVIFSRQTIFMGRRICRGMPTVRLIRLFRYGKAVCENRMMDEHMQLLEGEPVDFRGAFCDHNLHDIGWWTTKHNGYALREAADLLNVEFGFFPASESVGLLNEQASAKRAKKSRYARMPLFWRAFAYFVYRYIVKLGFLEGAPGFMWHFLQGWWYRTLVDAKIYQIRRACMDDQGKISKEKIIAYLKERGVSV